MVCICVVHYPKADEQFSGVLKVTQNSLKKRVCSPVFVGKIMSMFCLTELKDVIVIHLYL
jgi:hypothetical protein